MPHHGSHRLHSGRDSHFYLYEEPKCFCNGAPCLCPDTGAVDPAQSDFTTIYPGWNVWDVYQVNDLPFSIMMIGVDKDRQLRIWVEDAVRLGAPGALVADSIDLKGGQIEILNGPPEGLTVADRKETVSGPAMVVSGPATLRTVRFYNRGNEAEMAWPHDDSYLLDKDYVPSPSNPATSGPAPNTIAGTVGSGVIAPVKEFIGEIPSVVYIGAALIGGLYAAHEFGLFGKVKNVSKRIRNNRRASSG